ncbi:MAG: quinate 5-dehydrogenase [Bacillota bacterium]
MPGADGTARVVSISLGSSTRDHLARAEFLGRQVILERRGTDGDISKAIALVRELDGQVDAFGMGGIDLYLQAGRRRYRIRDAVPIARAARITPMVDGCGLKDTLERRVISYLVEEYGLPLRGKTVLMVSAMDRFGMAEALVRAGCRLILGDLMFGLGVPVPLHTLRSLDLLARVLAPVIVQLPFRLLYPTGKKQKERRPRFTFYYERADIIAGDYLFIAHHMPDHLPGKIIITNTVTPADVEALRACGVSLLVTTTPQYDGRSFGTNVMQAVMVALSGRRPEELTARDYEEMLDRLGFRPRIERLN